MGKRLILCVSLKFSLSPCHHWATYRTDYFWSHCQELYGKLDSCPRKSGKIQSRVLSCQGWKTRRGNKETVFSNHYFHSLNSCTVVKTRKKCVYKEIILSQAFKIIWLKYVSMCLCCSSISLGYGIYILSSYLHQGTFRTGHVSISNTTYFDFTFLWF